MNRFTKQLLPFCSLIFIISLWTFLEPDTFLSVQNFKNVLSRSSINGIMAAGMTYIIITAGIDLSVGSMLAMCGRIGSVAMLGFRGASLAEITGGSYVEMTSGTMIMGSLVGIAVGGLCGFANGMLITRLKLAPFIVTLGMMSIFRGAAYLMNDGKPFAVSDYAWLDIGTVAGIPSAVLLFFAVLGAAGFVLKYTPFGRYTYAIGSNVETAFHAGIDVNKVLVTIYTVAGICVGLAAMITTSRASTSQPTAGLALELDIIAAVIIGGCSPSGGKGTMTGTVIGTLLISFLRNGLTLLDVSTNIQLVVIGGIILLAVTTDQIATKREK
ncbi:MAG: ABC transporter permease [Planctomycetota bacterium]|jgi:ribose/xylose/arabinose/galactoside ABC-type transport system permease subunit